MGSAALLVVVALSVPPGETGSIEGVVVNASRGHLPSAGAEVVLQVHLGGQFVPVETTTADAEGRYRFTELPLGEDLLYLPGASLDGIHYPGRRIQLTSDRPAARLALAVHEAVGSPNPLVVRQHEIVVRGEPGVWHVVEAVLVDNPSPTTYVGHAEEEQPTVTFELGIPSTFEQLTFEEEFFGRNFRVVDGRVVTDVPWTPGSRWLRYTYSLADLPTTRSWQRRLELPCEQLRVRVGSQRPEEVRCNLPAAGSTPAGERVFETAGEALPAGFDLQLTLGRPAIPWTVYARWAAIAVLLSSLAAVAAVRRRAARCVQTSAEGAERRIDPPHAGPPPPGLTAASRSAKKRGRRPRARPSSSGDRKP